MLSVKLGIKIENVLGRHKMSRFRAVCGLIKMKRLHAFLLTISLLVCNDCETRPTPREDAGNHANAHPYSTYSSFEALVAAEDAKYVEPIRITSPGTKDQPTDHYEINTFLS